MRIVLRLCSRGAATRWAASLAICTLILLRGQQQPLTGQSLGIARPALDLVNDLALAARAGFYVFLDSDSGHNHGFFSGWFPGSAVTGIHLNTACVYDPAAATGCAADPTRTDPTRRTVVAIGFDPQPVGTFAGINVEEPENYGVNQRGVGYDLRGATRVCFDTVAPASNPVGFEVQFLVAQHPTPFMPIPSQWTEMCFSFASLGLSDQNLADVHFLFTIVTNDVYAPLGGHVLLDRIRFEPVPAAQQMVLSFPLANEVRGVVPVADVLPGRVQIPPDQVLANLTTTYESAMAMLVLFGSGNESDAASARLIADAFVYVLTHDNHGDPIPPASDGSTGPHNAYFSGDVTLHNDQGAGQGRRGEVRLSGFRVESNLCGPSQFCLVLDGATGGNSAFAMMALEASYLRFGDPQYLDAARTIGNWISGNLADTTGTGFGGYYLGYPDEGQTKQIITGKSIENNADIFVAMTKLSDITRALGTGAEADAWAARAQVAGDYVMNLFDSASGRFYAGSVPLGTTPGPGIRPDGPRQGTEVANTAEFLDAQTFVLLPMASSPRYRNAIDWRRPVAYMLSRFHDSVTVNGHRFEGFNLVPDPSEGPRGIAYEFTAQAVVAMRFVDALYGETTLESTAQFYLQQIRDAQQLAPFTDGRGLVASVLQDADQVPPYEQCLSTPFQCVASRVGLAATTWAIAADLNVNPFRDSIVPAGPVTTTQPVDQNVAAGATVALSASASASPPPTVRWQVKASGASAFIDIAGATSASYVFMAAVADNGKQFRAVFTNPFGTAISDAATLTVSPTDVSDRDTPLVGDIDGDGRGDFVVWRRSTGMWFWLTSSSGYAYGAAGVRQWGNVSLGDVPMLADMDGDGKADLVVWRGSTGTWFCLTSSSGFRSGAASVQWGDHTFGDVPLMADLDGDGKGDPVAWRATTGTWWWLKSSIGLMSGDSRQWGDQSLGDIPRTADVDGDGTSDPVVWRASTGTWWWLKSSIGLASGDSRQWGNQRLGDVPFLADLDGDRKADLIVWRESTGTWFWLTSSSGYGYGAAQAIQWGQPRPQ